MLIQGMKLYKQFFPSNQLARPANEIVDREHGVIQEKGKIGSSKGTDKVRGLSASRRQAKNRGLL